MSNTRTLTAETCEPADSAPTHRWSPTPIVRSDDPPGTRWWFCLRCPAQVLHDAEREDGFPAQPIVVFPTSTFAVDGPCGCPRTAAGEPRHLAGCLELDPVTKRDLDQVLVAGTSCAPARERVARLMGEAGARVLRRALVDSAWHSCSPDGCEICATEVERLRSQVSAMADRLDDATIAKLGAMADEQIIAVVRAEVEPEIRRGLAAEFRS